MFTERIKQLREGCQIQQRVLAAALEIDTATYCKIEKGERRVRKEYIPVIAKLLQADYEELLKFWLADQVYDLVGEEENKNEVLHFVSENISEYERRK
jgi:transcriptional regulator with XRE-family HTH domain